MKEVVQTDAAPAAIGPYSQAIKANGMLFLSGQIPLDPATGKLVAGGVEEQTHQVFKNLKAVLAAGGATFEDVVRADVFLADMGEFAAVNAIYAEYFCVAPQPARQTIEASKLPLDVKVEISCIAAL